MLKKLAKLCAKFVIGYLPDVALWLVRLATEKTAESDKAKRALAIVQQVSRDSLILSEIMADGIVSEIEAEQVKMRAQVLSDEISELL